jgi:hypothetical protein
VIYIYDGNVLLNLEKISTRISLVPCHRLDKFVRFSHSTFINHPVI